MRRIPASFLLVLLCFGFALPFLQAQPSNIPACCRRDGKHHCGMSPNGDGFRTRAPNCPYRTVGVLTSPTIALNVRPSVLSISADGALRIQTAPLVVALRTPDNTQ